jgi:hypothetical protein
MKAEHLDEQPSITNIDDELRTVLNLFGNHIISYSKNGETDYPELFTDTIETIQNIYTNKIKEAELRGRIKENNYWVGYHLDGEKAKVHHKRLTQLTNQYKGDKK